MSITVTDEFVAPVGELGGLDRDAARAATEAVLEALGLRITAGAAHDLAERLPEELREPLLRGARRFEAARRLALKEFLALVAGRERVSLEEAREHTRAVLAALREAVGAKEVADAVAQLPREFAAVLPEGATATHGNPAGGRAEMSPAPRTSTAPAASEERGWASPPAGPPSPVSSRCRLMPKGSCCSPTAAAAGASARAIGRLQAS